MISVKTPLLFLCHRMPYPPNKGDKIRAWHLLCHLAKTHKVYLATFVDDPVDWQYSEKLKEVCEQTYLRKLNPFFARLKSLIGFLKGQPLTLPYYFDPKLQQWVNSKIDEYSIKEVVVYSSAMAQYVLNSSLPLEKRIIDFVDVDSDKWRQYAKKMSFPKSFIYGREAEKLLAFEIHAANKSDQSYFVSTREAELFKKLAPDIKSKVSFFNNGVNSDYFSPEVDLSNPYEPNSKPLVFTGAMDYWPNIDAVCWFANDIFPAIKQKHPALQFVIVGSNPADQVKQLEKVDGVIVTGTVADVRPYIKYALTAVIPLRIARGIQNKVLEAMSMSKPVIVSPQALEGLDVENAILLAASNNDYGQFIDELIQGKFESLGNTARLEVLKKFTWDGVMESFDRLQVEPVASFKVANLG